MPKNYDVWDYVKKESPEIGRDTEKIQKNILILFAVFMLIILVGNLVPFLL